MLTCTHVKRDLRCEDSMQDQGGWYDVSSSCWEGLQDVVIIGCTRPGAAMSPRCTRHMTTIYMPMPTEESMRRMFHPIVDSFFAQNFPAEVQDAISRAVVAAAVEAHACIVEHMLPTPATPQYRFNLHTLSAALQVLPPATSMLNLHAWFLSCLELPGSTPPSALPTDPA